nr:hypothetical protein [Pseudomonas oleovorans]
MSEFEDELTSEIDRLDVVGDGTPRRVQYRYRDNINLDSPGLGLVAGRSAAIRRPGLANLILGALSQAVEGDVSKVLVFANSSKNLLTREIVAIASQLEFSDIDNVHLSEEGYRRLVNGINRISQLGVLHEDDAESEAPGEEETLSWSGGPVSHEKLKIELSTASPGTVAIVENLLEMGTETKFKLVELRNEAAKSGVYLYMGVGTSHWPEVRKNKKLVLSDLDEDFFGAVHVADKISLFDAEGGGLILSIFDNRQVEPWRGPFNPQVLFPN